MDNGAAKSRSKSKQAKLPTKGPLSQGHMTVMMRPIPRSNPDHINLHGEALKDKFNIRLKKREASNQQSLGKSRQTFCNREIIRPLTRRGLLGNP